MELTDIANRYALDKGTIIPRDGRHHGPRLHFTPIYESYMGIDRNLVNSVVEIGVENGNSLKMWAEYFPNAKIYGLDINDKSIYNTDRITCYKVDQSNSTLLDSVLNTIATEAPIDVFIDDGSHVVSHQQTTLFIAFKYLSPNGYYWIEDLHTSDASVWNGKTLYGNDMTFSEGESTVDVLHSFIDTNQLNSPFLTTLENESLTHEISICRIFDIGSTVYGFNKLALLRKC